MRSIINGIWLSLCCIGLITRAEANQHTNIQTVFIIVMENVSWSAIKASASAPYINSTLLPMASYCEQYYTAPGVASSLPDYLWLEGGTNYGITTSPEPSTSAGRIRDTNHLVTVLFKAGISWKSYQENISGTTCPTNSSGLYAAYHNPHVYFDDVTTNAAYCLAHIRPYTELARDLRSNTVARYNFITPNLCDDMHNGSGCATTDRIRNGDNWLAQEIPRIMNSQAYSNNGAIFLTWDESNLPPTASPIGMIVMSPLAKGHGYFNTNYYTHASTLRTMQEIFGVRPFLYGAHSVGSLADLFLPTIRLETPKILGTGNFQFNVAGDVSGKTNVVQNSADLKTWTNVATNNPGTNSYLFTTPTTLPKGFFRLRQQF